jgi:hypothetical protein
LVVGVFKLGVRVEPFEQAVAAEVLVHAPHHALQHLADFARL